MPPAPLIATARDEEGAVSEEKVLDYEPVAHLKFQIFRIKYIYVMYMFLSDLLLDFSIILIE